MQIGNINLMLLKALKDGSKYGLEIVKFISEETNGEIEIKQPSLYSGLTRLEKRGLISSHWEDSDIGGRRHYYTITDTGINQLKLHENNKDNDNLEEEVTPKQAKEKNEIAKKEPLEPKVFEISKQQIENKTSKNDLTPIPQIVEMAETDSAVSEPVIEKIDLNKKSTPKNPVVETFDDSCINLFEEESTFEDKKESPKNNFDASNLIEEDDYSLMDNIELLKNQNAVPAPKLEKEEKAELISNDESQVLGQQKEVSFEEYFKNPALQTHKPSKIEKFETKETSSEKNAKVVQQTFQPYSPKKSNDVDKKSFSQKMRDYVEPTNKYAEYEFSKQKPEENKATLESNIQQNKEKDRSQFSNKQDSFIKESKIETTNNNITEQQKVATFDSSILNDTQVEYINNNDDINYKDILGDLDADLNKNNTNSKYQRSPGAPIEKANVDKNKDSKRSAYSKKLEEILVSANGYMPPSANTKIERIDNEKRFEELNRRYEGNIELKNKATQNENNNAVVKSSYSAEQSLEPSTFGYTHINQDKITIKPYIKEQAKQSADKIYLYANKLNLFRALLMFLIMCSELAGTFYYFYSQGVINLTINNNTIFYIVSLGLALFYLVLMLAICLPNLNKKVLLDNISWGMDLFYRFLLTVILLTFVIALNIFLGMTSLTDTIYIIQWLIPSMMIVNILISSPVGLIIYSTGAFRL